MRPIRRLIHEAHRRSLWQVIAIYAFGAWAAYQVILGLRDGVGLPDWVPAFAIVLFLIGLPIVVATAFVQEGGPSKETWKPEATPEQPETVADDVGAQPQEAGASGGVRHVLTWRRSLLAGVGAFVLLGLGTGGWMAMRVLGIGPVGTLVAQGVLDDRERIILADFRSVSGDSILAAVTTEAFRIDIAQSPTVTILEPSQVQDLLERSQRPTDSRIDAGLARDLAQRGGIKAVLTGDVADAGGGYILTASLVSASSGDPLASARETAADSTQLLGAVDKLSAKLRERIGESLKSIHASDPLEQVTTSSLEALRRLSMAERAFNNGDDARGIALLEDAIRLDSTFAMAYRRLAAALDTRLEEPERALEAARAAVRFGDHLSDRERLHAEAYLAYEIGRWEDARTAYESLLELDPDDDKALNNLGLVYGNLGDDARSAELLRRSLVVDSLRGSTFGGTFTNLAGALLDMGDTAGARAAIDAYRKAFPGNPEVKVGAAAVLAGERRYRAAADTLEQVAGDPTVPMGRRASAEEVLGVLSSARGRPVEAGGHFENAANMHEQRGRRPERLSARLQAALADAWVAQRYDAATRAIDDALRESPLDSMPTGDRPYLLLAAANAAAGRGDEAARVIERYRSDVIEDLRRPRAGEEMAVSGLVALQNNDVESAERDFRNGERLIACHDCLAALSGRAEELRNRPDSAIVAYEAYLASTFIYNVPTRYSPMDLPNRAWMEAAVHERLGELYAQKGDTASAVRHYSELLELWEDAEPELRPRVENARRRLAALGTKG